MTAFRLDFVALRRILVLMSLPLVALVLAGVVGARDGAATTGASDATLRDLRVFSEVLQLTGRNYVDDVDMKQLERGAYQGLAESLDPWSSFRDDARMAELTKGDTSGDVGLLLLKHPQQYVRIVVVVPGSPADAAGIKAGQYIETIDGHATKDMALLEAEAMLRGAPGSHVKLGFFRTSDDEETGKVLDVERKDLASLRVVERRLDPKTSLLRVTDLAPGTRDLVAAKLKALREAGVKDLVLDLRANVGGSPDEALGVADLLAPAGAAFQRVTPSGATTESTKDAAAWDGGLVVLVDRGTVGEAELLAESLRKLAGAKLVGRPTLGKTTQQDLVRLSGGIGLSISVAEYRQADGKDFGDDGIQPDEKVARIAKAEETAPKVGEATAPGPEGDEDDAAGDAAGDEDGLDASGEAGPGHAKDAQVEKALELLKAAPAPARKAA